MFGKPLQFGLRSLFGLTAVVGVLTILWRLSVIPAVLGVCLLPVVALLWLDGVAKRVRPLAAGIVFASIVFLASIGGNDGIWPPRISSAILMGAIAALGALAIERCHTIMFKNGQQERTAIVPLAAIVALGLYVGMYLRAVHSWQKIEGVSRGTCLVDLYVYHDYPHGTFAGYFYGPVHFADSVVRYSFWRAPRPPRYLLEEYTISSASYRRA